MSVARARFLGGRPPRSRNTTTPPHTHTKPPRPRSPPQKNQRPDTPQAFYEDLFEELARYGEVEAIAVCDNVADHMVGNVYARFRDERDASSAMIGLSGRVYAGVPVSAELSPVTDFREAACRQYDEGGCNRGGYCNFMHVKPLARDLRQYLYGRYGRSGAGGGGGLGRYGSGGGGGGGGYGGGRRRVGGGGGGGGGGRRRSPSPERGRERYGGGNGGGAPAPRDDSEERRARIAAWAAQQQQQQEEGR